MEQVIRNRAAATVGLAATELILAIQKEFPPIRLVPCESIEGEDIHNLSHNQILGHLKYRLQHSLILHGFDALCKHDNYRLYKNLSHASTK